jgi:KDO2-lipid IV(A) lauroyltransferase
MNFQDRMKKFKRASARWGIFFATGLFNHLPYSVVRFIMNGFLFIGYILIVKQKRLTMESLEIAFGKEKNAKERKAIARACFRNLGQGMMELIYFMGHPIMIKKNIRVEGQEHLEKALAQGKGVIAVSAHFGNFPLMLLYFAQIGYKTNAIIRQTRDEIVEKYFLKLRTSLGLNTIYAHPRITCVNTSIKVLRDNQILFIPLDQNFGSAGGVFVNFFGQKAATATGPVVFAKRTGAPIVPMFIVREKKDIYKVIIEPPMAFEEKDTDEETIYVNTAKITQTIERYVRKYPSEWGWMHRRWKSKPPEQDLTNDKDIAASQTIA